MRDPRQVNAEQRQADPTPASELTATPVTVGDFRALLAGYGINWDQVCEPPFITLAPGAPDDHEVFLVVTLNVRDRGSEFVPFMGSASKREFPGRRDSDLPPVGLAQETRWLPLRVIE